MDLRTDEHQFLAISAGFLSGEITPGLAGAEAELILRHHNVDGEVVYEYSFRP
jgi:hypothetical protein